MKIKQNKPLIEIKNDTKELINSMPEEIKATSVTETVTTSETEKEETPNDAAKTTEETTPTEEAKNEEEVKAEGEENVDEPFDLESMRKTFSKLRDELKTLKKEKDETVSKLKEKEEQEAAARGEYKEIAEKKAADLREAEARIAELQAKIDTEVANEKKKFAEQEKAINKMINQQTEPWSDEAKALIDKEGQVTAAERLRQFEKAAPLVQKLLKSPNPAPGFNPTPRDVREQGEEGTGDVKEQIRRQMRKGRLVNI